MNPAPDCIRKLCLLVLAALPACTVGPDFTEPESRLPASWKSSDSVESRPIPEQWWTLFSDPELTGLVEKALQHNPELWSGAARVEQARAAAGLARAVQFPAIGLEPSADRERFSGNRTAPSGTRTHVYTANFFELPLTVSYEVDLWGRLRRQREAAEASARATEYDYSALSLAVSSEVARTYFALRSLQREETLLTESLDWRRRAVEIVEGRARAGISNDLDVSRARVELSSVESDLQAVSRNRAMIENALAVLCGEFPSGFTVATAGALQSIPDVPPGLPSELLRRRPDIAAAIERVHDASARIGLTKAEAYPQLSLSGTLGLVSSELSKFFESESQTWTLGAFLRTPLYRGGAFDLRNRAAAAYFDERSAEYRSTLLVAFREVEDALSALARLHLEQESSARGRDASTRAVELANGLYRQGLIGYLDVIDANRTDLDARRRIILIERLRADSTVMLVKSLGGGWTAPQRNNSAATTDKTP